MGKVAEFASEARSIGEIAESLIRPLNPEGFIEFQLRQCVSEAVKELGRDKAWEIIREAAE